MTTTWKSVSRGAPCPKCKRTSWCGVTVDGAVVRCMRVSEGSRRTDAHGGHIHVLQPGHRPEPVQRLRFRLAARHRPDAPMLARLAAEQRDRAVQNPRTIERLAELLGVSCASLDAIETGWTGRAWSWPMRDHAAISGIRYRGLPRPGEPTQRWQERGSSLGIIGKPSVSRRRIVVEGESDLAASHDIGVGAFAVPGAGTAIDVVRTVARGADLVIVVDADEPGHAGGLRLARACYVAARSVRVIEAPRPVGDLREAVLAGMTRVELLHAIELAPCWTPRSAHVFDFEAFCIAMEEGTPAHG